MRPIMDLCEDTVQMTGTWVARRWWEQEGQNLAVARAAMMAVEELRVWEEPGRDKTE